jgi:hypothetical protein
MNVNSTLLDLCRKYDCVKTRNKYPYSWNFVQDIYPSYLEYRRHESLRVLEIGVFKGGFLRALQEYLPNAVLAGVDKQKLCDLPNIEIGDQEDYEFMSEVGEKYAPLDLVIDDGGHQFNQQVVSYQALWPHLSSGGLYVIEDVVEGGHEGHQIFDYIKTNLLTSEEFVYNPQRPKTEISSISFYKGLIVIQKGSQCAS